MPETTDTHSLVLNRELNQSPSLQTMTTVPIYRPGPAINRKSIYLLGETIKALFRKHTTEHVLFVTLTFPEKTRHLTKASTALKSFLNEIRKRYKTYLWVLHTHSDGGIHYHLLLPVTENMHEGTQLGMWKDRPGDFDVRCQKAMNKALRAHSDWFANKTSAYGFGRTEVAPVYSNGEAVANYLSKTDWRLNFWPFEEYQRVRFWECSRALKAGSTKFSWNSPRSRDWRRILGAWAMGNGCFCWNDLGRIIGRYWPSDFFQYLTEVRAAKEAEAERLYIPSTRRPFGVRPAPSLSQPEIPPMEATATRAAPEVSEVRCDILSEGGSVAVEPARSDGAAAMRPNRSEFTAAFANRHLPPLPGESPQLPELNNR